jgi:RHS repeat-associated protein
VKRRSRPSLATQRLSTTGTTGTATTPLGYDGQYTSSDTGLIYLRARTYDPKTAQFMSLDPALEATGTPYSYAGDSPVNATDPFGLSSTFDEELEVKSNITELQTDIGIWQGRLRERHGELLEAQECGNGALARQKVQEERVAVTHLIDGIQLLKENFARRSELERKEIAEKLMKLLIGHGICTPVGMTAGALGAAGGGWAGEAAAEAAGEELCMEVASR